MKKKYWISKWFFLLSFFVATFLVSIFVLYNRSSDTLILKEWKNIPTIKNNKNIHRVFNKTCNLYKKKINEAINQNPISDFCSVSNKIMEENRIAELDFFYQNFKPIKLRGNYDGKGLATGYFEIEINASYKERKNSYPIYKKPKNLISINLEKFNSDLDNITITGKIKNNQFLPLPTRAQINNGYYSKKNLEIAWANDDIEAYFLHIQGSGRLKMDDGSVIKIGYDGNNGHMYSSIGNILYKRGELNKRDISMYSIKNWLRKNPVEGKKIMNTNKRYIFFKENKQGPYGSAGVALSPNISVAVDTKLIPLGMPLVIQFIDKNINYSNIVIAQDTGSAIKGLGRIDIFMGYGKKAEQTAAYLSDKINVWALVPNEMANLIKLGKIKKLTEN